MKTAAKPDPLGHLILAAPVFLFYHIGLLVSPQAANGADPITRGLGYLAGLSRTTYLIGMAVLIAAYALAVKLLARKRKFDPGRFPVVLLEGTIYALIMGPLAGMLLQKMHVLGSTIEQMGLIDRVVASAGAGFYEELVFRMLGVGVLVWLFGKKLAKTWVAVTLALILSAALFALAHYVGQAADPFTLQSFLFRLVLGVMLGGIFLFRGFATAVYAHFLYDVWVMCFLMR